MIPQKLNRSEAAVLNDGKLTLRFYEFLNGLTNYLNSTATSSPTYGGVEVTVSTTLTGTSATAFCDATAGNIVITLPTVALNNYFNVIKTDASVNTVTVSSTDGIIGSATQVLTSQYDSIELIGSSNEYYVR